MGKSSSGMVLGASGAPSECEPPPIGAYRFGRTGNRRAQPIRVTQDAPDLELSLPARSDNVAVCRQAIGGLREVVDDSEQTLADIKLAVTEACTNVVVHAYPESEGMMGLRASVDDHELHIVVTDTGRGVTPRTDSPGLGLGLPLIASLTQSLELGGGGEGEETQVRMTFRLEGLRREEP